MKRFQKLLIGVLGVFALGYGLYQFIYPTATFRYKLTAEVMTPDGLKTGSSVIEVSYSSGHPFPNPGRWRQDTVTGEAVYVDLGSGKNLFVLLGADKWERTASRTPGNQGGVDGIEGGRDAHIEKQLGEGSLNVLWLPVHVFKIGRFPGQEWDMQRRANKLFGAPPYEVPMINVPLVGTFIDISKPETFNTVPPGAINAVLGEGYALQSVKMQIVGEGVQERIREVLPWLSKLVGGLRERPDRTKPDMRASIGETYFKSFGYGLEI